MNWIHITSEETLKEINEESYKSKVLLFKFSPSCSINMIMKYMLEREWNKAELENVKTYIINVLGFRHVSNQIESEYGVEHKSPQVIIISNGKSIYDCSHGKIRYSELRSVIRNDIKTK